MSEKISLDSSVWIKKNCYLCCAQIEAYKCDLQKNSFVKY